jgi:transposase InsO family protein
MGCPQCSIGFQPVSGLNDYMSTRYRSYQFTERFDQYRNCYNIERPHEALQLRVPASCYQSSLRAAAQKLPELKYL